MKDDLISKTAAIDAVEEIPWYHQNKNGEMVQGANSREHQAWYKADDIYHALYTLPPAQPVNIANLQQNCNQVASDCISRQAALETLNELARENFSMRDSFEIYLDTLNDVEKKVKALPSAQPDIETLLKLAVAMAKPIEYLNLSVRSYNALKRRGVDSVAKVYELKQKENLKKIRNIGAKSADEIEDCLSAYLVQWEGGQDEQN